MGPPVRFPDGVLSAAKLRIAAGTGKGAPAPYFRGAGRNYISTLLVFGLHQKLRTLSMCPLIALNTNRNQTQSWYIFDSRTPYIKFIGGSMKRGIIHYVKATLCFLDERIEEILIVCLCLALVLSLTYTVIVRYALHTSFLTMISYWAEEIAGFAFIWLLYIGAALATKREAHFRVTVQFELLPERLKKYSFIPGNLVWIGFNLCIIKFGWQLVQSSAESSLALEIPMKFVYAIIPGSFVLITFRLLRSTFKSLMAIKEQGGNHA